MQLHCMEDELEELGARLVVVGNGSPSFIAGFREKSGFTGALYSDPSRVLYRSLQLERGLRSSINGRSMARAVSAFRSGHRQSQVQGDAFQQGGVFVITSKGESTLEYRSQFAGDHPTTSEIRRAVVEAAALSNKGQSYDRT